MNKFVISTAALALTAMALPATAKIAATNDILLQNGQGKPFAAVDVTAEDITDSINTNKTNRKKPNIFAGAVVDPASNTNTLASEVVSTIDITGATGKNLKLNAFHVGYKGEATSLISGEGNAFSKQAILNVTWGAHIGEAGGTGTFTLNHFSHLYAKYVEVGLGGTGTLIFDTDHDPSNVRGKQHVKIASEGEGTATVKFMVNANGATGSLEAGDTKTVDGTKVFNGTDMFVGDNSALIVDFSKYDNVAAGFTADILKFGTFTGAFGSMEAVGLAEGLVADFSQIAVDGTVTVNAIPEPASFALIGLGSLFLLPRRRK